MLERANKISFSKVNSIATPQAYSKGTYMAIEDDIKRLAQAGILSTDIAKYVQLPLDELKEKYEHLIVKAHVDRSVEIAHAIYQTAIEGNMTAATLWIKNIGKWEKFQDQPEDIQKSDILTDIEIKIGTTKEDFGVSTETDEP